MAAGPFEATVSQVRSFDAGIYLVLSNNQHGWILDPNNYRLHAIAAAAQATGKKVWIRYDSYDPSWPPGPVDAGMFFGVKMSFQNNNFPPG